MITEADILNGVIAPEEAGLPAEAARALLHLAFKEPTREHIRALLQANNRGELPDADRAELEKYLRVGQFLDLLQAKARLSLQEQAHS
jgi:hypothetical protein